MEEIEERYKKEIENADSEFLKGLEGKKDIAKLEEDYRIRFNNAIKKYEEECLNYLEKEKKKAKIKKNSFSDNKKNRKLKIKSFSLKPGFSDKSKIKIALFFFRIKIKLKKIINRILPIKLMLWYISAKKSIKTIIKDSNNSLKASLHRKKTKIYSIAEKQIEIILSVCSKLKNQVVIIYNKLKLISKKKQDEKKEGNEKEGEKKEKEEKVEEKKEGEKKK